MITKTKGNLNIKDKSKDIFSKQVDDVIKGISPKRNMLIISENTPQILQDIGLKDLPITITQKHLYTIINSHGKYEDVNYHNIPIEVIKQLPTALEHPLNILKSNTKDDSIVVITELADRKGDIIIASIQLNGKGTINDIRISTNVVTSAYGKANYDNFMKDNINQNNMLYDIDRGIISKF
ncbi:MAG: hypothetical protein NC483_06185 [Ruminococcus sp.]|nr:hypothetical protein [Ruminococcus sp.]